MDTIKIYLASGDDLQDEHLEMYELVERLNRVFRSRQMELELITHGEELGKLEDCELCLTLYYTNFGSYPRTDFENAYNDLTAGRNPKKIYVFFKNCPELNDKITQDLQDFKEIFADKYGHFFCKFENVDTMRLEFLMQLEIYNSGDKLLKVENQQVQIEGEHFVNLANIPFAALNDNFQELSQGLVMINENIMLLEQREHELKPEEKERLQKYYNTRYAKSEKLKQLQNSMLDTALNIAKLSSSAISEQLQEAIDCFNAGNLSEAIFLLKQISAQKGDAFNRYDRAKEILQEEINGIIKILDAAVLRSTAVLGHLSLSIEERIEQAQEAYLEAIECAKKIDYDKAKLLDLLFNYTDFLFKYSKFNLALDIAKESLYLAKELYGEEHASTAMGYHKLGRAYDELGEYDIALEYYEKALPLRQKILGEEHADTATTYSNMGVTYDNQGDYDKALELYKQALAIRLEVLGEEHKDTAATYNNMAVVYQSQGDYNKALELYKQALAIRLKVLGEEHADTAGSYNNMAIVYQSQGDYNKALELHEKSLAIKLKVLGEEHADTATTYNNMGNVYNLQEDYDNALKLYKKSLVVRLKVLDKEHVNTANNYHNMGVVYDVQGDYDKALKLYKKTLSIKLKALDAEHIDIARIYFAMAHTYENSRNYSKALKYYEKALPIFEQVLGHKHESTKLIRDLMQNLKYSLTNSS